MLLRSSSTPVLGSLLSSFSDSSSHSEHNRTSSFSDNHKNLSFFSCNQPNYHFFSCNSSPISHSIVGMSEFGKESSTGPKGFRRARSDGNLQGLAASDVEEFHNTNHQKSSRRPTSVLQTIPSFSVYNSKYEFEDEEEGDEGVGGDGGSERSVTIGNNITSFGGDFSFSNGKGMGLVEEEDEGPEESLSVKEIGNPLFLARGLGIDVNDPTSALIGCGGAGGCDFPSTDYGGGADGSDIEAYYKRMVEENPCNGLFLRNYAQYLYQSKRDYHRAEDYYSRAILEEPADGEVLSQYAKLVWERHHDHERASSYFEQAVQAAPEDSHVHAAYASFLWETEEEDEGVEEDRPQGFAGLPVSHGAMASATA